MRKWRTRQELSDEYQIMVVDDEEGIVDSVTAMLTRGGYQSRGFTNALDALAELEQKHYDLLILDYFMQPIRGDEMVERIRKDDYELYILLLTGHKEIAPPVDTLKSLAIQAYCEKGDRMDQLQLLVESAVKSISQMRTIKQFQDGLNSILGAVPKIYQLQPIDGILEEVLQQILPLVKSEDAFILVDEVPDTFDADLVEHSGDNRSIFCGVGSFQGSIDTFMNTLDHELMEAVGKARVEGNTVHVPGGVILPLCEEQGRSLGVIYAQNASGEYGIKLLEIYARQAASSISNAFLHSLVNVKNEKLNETYAELRARYMDTVEVLRLTVDAKDEYTRGHSDRVAALSVLIGRACGLGEEKLEKLHTAGLFHDIGKIGMADDILLKTNFLNEEEYEAVKRHPLKGAMILSAVSMFEDIAPAVLHHHEWFDGTGYPDGIAGEQIEFPARIIAVADALDAMTSDRQYRSHLPFEEAKNQLRLGSGTQFDPAIVDCLFGLIESDGGIVDIIRR